MDMDMDIDTATVDTVSVLGDTPVAGALITHTVADIGSPKAAAGATEIVRARLLPDVGGHRTIPKDNIAPLSR
jgi:hypothetical protein